MPSDSAYNQAYYAANRERILAKKRGQRRALGVGPHQSTPLAERFAAKVVKTATCWLWTGALDVQGYGRVGITRTRTALAHRVGYALSGRALSDDMVLDHLCRTRSCVNPDHLEQVTQAENLRRARAPHQEPGATVGSTM